METLRKSAAALVACLCMGFVGAEERADASPSSRVGKSMSSTMLTRKQIGDKTFHISTTVIKAKPEHVWSVLTDYSRAPEVFSNLRQIELLSREGNAKKVKFKVASLGGLWKFDYVLHVEEKEPHQIEWRRHSGAFKSNEGYWKLTPVNGGEHTHVTYAKHVDGGFLMPRAIVDRQLRQTMAEVICNLRKAVQSDHLRLAARN